MHGTATLPGVFIQSIYRRKQSRSSVKAHGFSLACQMLQNKDLHLNGVVGQVFAMTVGNGMLFAGTSKVTDTKPDLFTYLKGCHSGEVTCFIVGGVVSRYTGMYNDSEATYRHGHLPPMSGSDGTRLTTSLVEVDKGLRISKVEIREAESLGYKIVGDALNGRNRELWLSGEERGRGGVDAEKRVVAR
ncbi:hypothetical protein YC2023_103244 [Brassica napus]